MGHEIFAVIPIAALAAGVVVARFAPRTVPDDPAVIVAIEKALQEE